MVAMKILSAAEMQACDRVTTEQFGVPSIDLMRNAASAVAAFVRLYFSAARRGTILCGRGNNGGDGMMTARPLIEAGLAVTTLLLGDPEGLKGDAAQAWAELTAISPTGKNSFSIVKTAEELADCSEALNADLIIDA